jgi:hypothetical protein
LGGAPRRHQMTTPLQALAYLARQNPTKEAFIRFQAEVNAEKNDRGAAILLGTNVENALQTAIDRNLVVREDVYGPLFHPSSGSLNSFEAKIRIGYAMGIYGDQHKNNLDCIKVIRNAFAHAVNPISFETAEVKAVCNLMSMPDVIPPRTIVAATGEPTLRLLGDETAKLKFKKVCEAVGHNLFFIGTTISPGIQCDATNVLVSMKARAVPLP